MIPALVLVPMLAGLAGLIVRRDAVRRAIVLAAAAAHAGLTAACWWWKPSPAWLGWLSLDAAGLLFLTITSGLFLAAAAYAVGYLGREERGRRHDFEEGVIFSNAPEAVFSGCLLFFLGTMTLVAVSQHLGILWVAVEATTLVSAPLIYFHRHHRSLEATWKYLMVCSVGIALALLGNFLLAVASSGLEGAPASLHLRALLDQAPHLHAPWLRAAFLFLLVGYGTKMGLAPLHTWLPDAHSEAPSVVSALLSGALLNCAFLGILRSFQVCAAAGEARFAGGLLVTFGLLSMGVGAVFILGQADYKRILAYSSVEHMGIMAVGIGLGGAAAFGSMFHAVNHSATKAMLFLLAGNLLAVYKTKSVGEVRGALRVVPITGALWAVGFLAIVGSPPFGTFLSEITILKAAVDQGRAAVAIAYLAFLATAFVGMGSALLRMVQGEAPSGVAAPPGREALLAVAPPLGLAAAVLLLGLYVPLALEAVLRAAARPAGW